MVYEQEPSGRRCNVPLQLESGMIGCLSADTIMSTSRAYSTTNGTRSSEMTFAAANTDGKPTPPDPLSKAATESISPLLDGRYSFNKEMAAAFAHAGDDIDTVKAE